ncbi:hypothetical protein V7R84_09375 [Arachnia propionica]|uniref:hypothetical protein n=1 Tax=Arachnia propionica TaxID=1750 RepID=UPI0030CDC6B9
MNGYLLLAIELAAILVVCVGLALFLGWVLGKRSARAKLAAEQDSSQTPATDALKTSRVEEKKEPTPLTSRAVPVTAQTSPVTTQSPSPIVASASDPQQPVSSPSPFAPSPSPTGNAAPAETGTARPDPLNDHTISDDSAVDTHLIPRIADQTTSPAPEPEASDPRLLDAEARANEAESKARDAETKAREAEVRIEEANQRAREAEAKAQEAEAKVEAAEAKVEEAGQQITQADQRVSEAEAKAQEADQMARAAETRAAEAETRVQEANQHINDAEQARRQVVELEERINKQEIDMARLENRATTAWDKTMPTLIERIESLEDDLSHARREAAELQAMLASERDQATPTPAPEADTEEEASEAEPVHEDIVDEATGQTEVIKEDSWQTIGPGTGAAQETPITFASSALPSMQPATEDEGENEEPEDLESAEETADAEEAADTEETADTKADATEEPEPTSVTAEDAPAEPVDTDPVDEKTDGTEENEEQQPTAEESATEESAEGEEPDVHSHEQLAPTAVVEHEVEIPDHDAHDEEPADLEPAEETADTKAAATEEPEPTSVTAEDAPVEDTPEEDAPAEPVDTDPVDEKTDGTEENEEQQPTAEESATEESAEGEEPEPDEEATETRLMPLIPEPTFTNFDELTAAWKERETVKSEEKPQSTSHTTAWPEPEDVEAVTATRLIPVIKDEEPAPRPNGKDDLEALTDTGSFARLIATGPAPEAPSFTAPLDIPGTEYLTPSTPAYPVTAHHDAATIPDIPRITAPIAQPFEAKQDDATPDSRHDATPSKSDLLIDETEVDEVPVTAGLAEPEPAADPRVNAGHIIAPQFSMTKEHDGILRSPLERKGQQISISLEEDYTLADPIDEEIEVMDAPEEEFPVGVGIPPEDYPRAR